MQKDLVRPDHADECVGEVDGQVLGAHPGAGNLDLFGFISHVLVFGSRPRSPLAAIPTIQHNPAAYQALR